MNRKLEKPALHFGVYHIEKSIAKLNLHTFLFVAGEKKNLKKHPLPIFSEYSLVRTIKIPEQFLEAVSRLVAEENKTASVGHIIYRTNQNTAYSGAYYPKENIDDKNNSSRPAPGLGYFLERECLNHFLENPSLGITHASTDYNPNDARAGQLKKAGLPLKTPVPIEKWIEGLNRGIKLSRKKQREG
mgnify:CR=1 FL=1